MKQISTLLFVLVCLFAGVSCAPQRGLNADHTTLVAWYIEDVVRGVPRRPSELQLVEATPATQRVANWISGGEIQGIYQPPRQIGERQRRWAALRALYAHRHVVVVQNGLLAPAPEVPNEDLAYITPIIDSENQDRRSIDALIIAMSDADPAAAKRWLSTSSDARITLDIEAGAIRWSGKPPLTSDPKIRVIP
jgi:hypothetical protein